MKIELYDVDKHYRDKVILSRVCAHFERGKIHGIVGENGVGKTTLLKIIAGLETPERGILNFDNQPLCKELAKHITYVEQTPYLLKGTVFYNVAYPLHLRRVPTEEIQTRVAAMLDELGISHLANRRADKLSAGESQKVVLARALIFNPKLLLLDEPTANIDVKTTSSIETSLIRRCQGTDMTILVVSHNHEHIERLCDHIYMMKRGHELCTQLELLPPAIKVQEGKEKTSAAHSFENL